MPHRAVFLTLLLSSLILSACAQSAQADNLPTKSSSTSCPVTQAQDPPFRPPEPYPAKAPYEGFFWHGSAGLWTLLPEDGLWWGLPSDEHGYTQKIFWWAAGYVWNEEPQPVFTLTGRRLDGDALRIHETQATNAYTKDTGSSILTGVAIPTLGCWEFTGSYRGSELSFIVLVEAE